MQTASFPEEEFQRFKFAQISHPLPVEIVDQVSLVHKDFSVPALAGTDGLHLALLHKLTDGVFGKSGNECGTLGLCYNILIPTKARSMGSVNKPTKKLRLSQDGAFLLPK